MMIIFKHSVNLEKPSFGR